MTPEYQARVKKQWEGYAKEEIELEVIGGTFYAFCSELAALRLYYTYRYIPGDKTKVAYSDNQGTWFFCMETDF
ncbi:hypothetical protein PHIM7_71 [Sinorhizobium phage phiM7]|uniref:Uncharacterized protein n=3 Tax=Emdodecavirus TaxID=1980937 RepID=S5MCU1_9CAUD|nr:hypothetical protein AB690_gp077 [Sinorhizobium phage phiM12]YP_009212327.1 hypothetical protein AVT40_gp087 [Sinorhizobium phage phiN3]YP_009601196.1 hypothetical protein FDH46_gp071 [Sinorhizobium phage phiM7]AKF12979.1 hypothetical protein PHIM19_72 [Sinorhizobium phage phiM19]AGR47724.1 hypothetical protein SmphiM12_092 [Sinorhizobium phage phiM12]AKF12619.1 hypothetical protein PHIM7_71 [Sinorhizobium phage phiM7]AKF13351.1 hypothetical protein PHIN3_87 [Sinorhizobium phage phiN3]